MRAAFCVSLWLVVLLATPAAANPLDRLAAAEQAAIDEPNNPRAHLAAGELLRRLRFDERAGQALARAAELSASDPPLAAEVALAQSRLSWDQANLQGARKQLDKALALAPDRANLRAMAERLDRLIAVASGNAMPLPDNSPLVFVHNLIVTLSSPQPHAALPYFDSEFLAPFVDGGPKKATRDSHVRALDTLLAWVASAGPRPMWAVAPELDSSASAAEAIVHVDVLTLSQISAVDIGRYKRAAADPTLRATLPSELAEMAAELPTGPRDAFFDRQRNRRILSLTPVRVHVAGAPATGFRVVDVRFGDTNVPLSSLAEVIRASQASGGGDNRSARNTTRLLLLAVAALLAMMVAGRLRQGQRLRRDRAEQRARRNSSSGLP